MKAYETFTNQKQWKKYIQELLATNKKALVKAILLIYNLQTPDEKMMAKSFSTNNEGFNKVDAREMCLIAKKIKRKEKLTKQELAKSAFKMKKYWKQLMIISKRNLQMQK